MAKNLKISFIFVISLWLIFLLDFIIPINFNNWGILPRTTSGLIGILLSTFLHANLVHLLSNTIPLFILTFVLLTFYKKNSLQVILIVILLGGFLVWLFARNSYHIGASGLIYGLVAFLVSCGIFQRNIKSIIISVIIFLLYGGIMYGVLPTNSYVSWEGHLFGALSGIFCGYIFRKKKESE